MSCKEFLYPQGVLFLPLCPGGFLVAHPKYPSVREIWCQPIWKLIQPLLQGINLLLHVDNALSFWFWGGK